MILFCIIGPSASGKGTQASLLSKSLHIPHITIGHILREMSEEETPMGQRLRRMINSGVAISADILRPILEEIFKTYQKRGVILDGFPRTRDQADMLMSFKNKQNFIDKLLVIVLKISDKEVIERAKQRLRKPGYVMQIDDDIDVVKEKLMLYNLQQKFIEKIVLKEFQAGRSTEYFEVDGAGTVEQIQNKILEYVQKTTKFYREHSQN